MNGSGLTVNGSGLTVNGSGLTIGYYDGLFADGAQTQSPSPRRVLSCDDARQLRERYFLFDC